MPRIILNEDEQEQIDLILNSMPISELKKVNRIFKILNAGIETEENGGE